MIEQDELYTGAFTLDDADGKGQFGLVAATSPLDSPGRLEMTLNVRKLSVSMDDLAIAVTLDEAQAERLHRELGRVLRYAEHLRILQANDKLKKPGKSRRSGPRHG